jgi:CRISPR-associated protein Csd1
MSILSALDRAYDSFEQLPQIGTTVQAVSFVLRIDREGRPVGVPDDIRTPRGSKLDPRRLTVPREPGKKITSGISPDFLWGKASYVLGTSRPSQDKNEEARIADQEKLDLRAPLEHAKFKEDNLSLISDSMDDGLRAVRLFLEQWNSQEFEKLGWPEDIRSGSMVFALEEEATERYIHERPAVRKLWESHCAASEGEQGICLITGEYGPIARLHPSVSGVRGAQATGASIASYNSDAFASYGWSQGNNASASAVAAFRYGMVLDHLLSRDSGHNFLVGDTTVVFWAEAQEASQASASVEMFGHLVQTFNQRAPSERIGGILAKLQNGQLLSEIDTRLADGVRFHVLGLAPNVSRLVVRFWHSDTFGALVDNYSRFYKEMQINGFDTKSSLQTYLRETAARGEDKNIAPNLAGEWMRSILTAKPYPSVLGSAVLLRLQLDGNVTPRRAQILKSLLIRNHGKDVPMALDTEFTNKGYLLGRLFSVYEQVQKRAVPGAKATIKDKFFGSALSSPRRTFPVLSKLAETHLSKIGKKDPRNLSGYFQRLIGDITNHLNPTDNPFPIRLTAEEQSFFALGYYQQTSFRKEKTSNENTVEKEIENDAA